MEKHHSFTGAGTSLHYYILVKFCINYTILIFLIKALVRLTENLGRKKTPVRTVTPPPAPAPAPVAVEEPEENEDELIAVITAAIACMMEEGTTFTVRHVKRVSTAPAWQKAGREEQIYSH